MGLYVFDRNDAIRFASEQGIKARIRGTELQFRKCPYCGKTTDDKNTFAISLDTGQFKCLRASCGRQGNMITLAKDFGFSLGTEADEYYAPRRKYRDISRYPVPITRDSAVQYLKSRGIQREITEKYHITTRKDNEKIVVFPFYDMEGSLRFVKYRNTDFKKGDPGSKEFCETDCMPILFGMDQCNFENPVLIVTEGQIDSLSVAACGIENAVSVPTGAKGFTWTSYCWDFLRRFKTLIVFGDHENGKITLLSELWERFHRIGQVKHVREEDYLDCKDANELLQKHGKQAIADAVNNAVPVEHPLIGKLSDVKPLNWSEMEMFESGIKGLDRLIGGFYFGQLVILTGKRGLGKSTLGSQLVISAIQSDYISFIYSGEMKSQRVQEWIDRQIAGSANISYTITKTGYKHYSVNEDKLYAIHSWYEDFLYFYNMEALLSHTDDDESEIGETNLLEVIEEAIKQYCCRVFFIDNLMIAMDEQGTDLNAQQTTFVKKLASLARVYNVLIFLVAHPKKTDREFDNDDVSGSSNITNLADMVIQYTKPKEDGEGDRVLRITKNRMTGQLETDGIPLWFEESSKRITGKQGVFTWKYGWETAGEEDEFAEITGESELLDEIPF